MAVSSKLLDPVGAGAFGVKKALTPSLISDDEDDDDDTSVSGEVREHVGFYFIFLSIDCVLHNYVLFFGLFR